MKKLFDLLIKGVGTALACFTIFGMIWDIINDGNYVFNNWAYTKMVVGSIIVGIGFSIPALIYYSQNIPYAMKIIVHMGIGCAIFLITSFIVGWIPVSLGIMECALVILLELTVAFFLWLIFTLYYKRMAKKMDKKIKSMNQQKDDL